MVVESVSHVEGEELLAVALREWIEEYGKNPNVDGAGEQENAEPVMALDT